MDPRIVVARTLYSRLRGLIGRPRDVALLLPRCRSVHTCFMRVALDLLWLDGDGRVVRVDRGVRPWRVRSCRRARSVLELRSETGRVSERQRQLGRENEVPTGVQKPDNGDAWRGGWRVLHRQGCTTGQPPSAHAPHVHL